MLDRQASIEQLYQAIREVADNQEFRKLYELFLNALSTEDLLAHLERRGWPEGGRNLTKA